MLEKTSYSTYYFAVLLYSYLVLRLVSFGQRVRQNTSKCNFLLFIAVISLRARSSSSRGANGIDPRERARTSQAVEKYLLSCYHLAHFIAEATAGTHQKFTCEWLIVFFETLSAESEGTRLFFLSKQCESFVLPYKIHFYVLGALGNGWATFQTQLGDV